MFFLQFAERKAGSETKTILNNLYKKNVITAVSFELKIKRLFSETQDKINLVFFVIPVGKPLV